MLFHPNYVIEFSIFFFHFSTARRNHNKASNKFQTRSLWLVKSCVNSWLKLRWLGFVVGFLCCDGLMTLQCVGSIYRLVPWARTHFQNNWYSSLFNLFNDYFFFSLLKDENLKKVTKASSQSDLDSGTVSGMPAAYHSQQYQQKTPTTTKTKGSVLLLF